MLAVALVILAAVGAGAGAERRWGPGARTAARRVLDVLVFVLLPVVTFFTVSNVELTTGLGAGLAFGWSERILTTVLAFAAGTMLLRLARPQVGAMMVCAGLANTGYLGVPLVAVLLGGGEAIGEAITYDVAVNATYLLLVAFGIGAAFGTRAGEGAGERLRAFLWRNPPLLAFVLALLAPDALHPAWTGEVARVLALALAPLGFFALGVYLMIEQEEGVRVFPPPLTAPVAWTLGLRLLVAPALMLVLSRLVGGVPEAFLVQAAMACGINSLAVAHVYGLDLRITTAAIAWSTAIVLAVAAAVAVTGGL